MKLHNVSDFLKHTPIYNFYEVKNRVSTTFFGEDFVNSFLKAEETGKNHEKRLSEVSQLCTLAVLILCYFVISFSKERMQNRELYGQHISSASTFLVAKCFIIVKEAFICQSRSN